MHRKSRPFIGFVAMLLLVMLPACGFHLRGAATLPPALSPLSIQGVAVHDPLYGDLRQLFRSAGIQLAADASGVGAVLHIIKQDQNRRTLSVDSRGKVVEYEIHQALEFELRDTAGALLMKRQSVGAQRVYENRQTDILGKSQEEDLLRRDLRRDLIRRVISRMQEQLQ